MTVAELLNGNMAQAREELGHIVCQELPPANTGTHMPSAHDVQVAIATMAVILANPDVVLRALGGKPNNEEHDPQLIYGDPWRFPDRRRK